MKSCRPSHCTAVKCIAVSMKKCLQPIFDLLTKNGRILVYASELVCKIAGGNSEG